MYLVLHIDKAMKRRLVREAVVSDSCPTVSDLHFVTRR